MLAIIKCKSKVGEGSHVQYLLCKLKDDERRTDQLKNTESINAAFGVQ